MTFEPRPQYTGLSIVVMFEQEISLIESLKELLKLHDEMVASIESMKNKIHKVENSRATNRFEVANEHRKTLEDKQVSERLMMSASCHYLLTITST